jgi:predicted nucleotidyltransferase
MQFQKPLQAYLFSPVKWKIVRFLLRKEMLISEREISKLLDVSHMSVNRTMKELEDLNFVSYVRVGRAHVWKVNRKSYAFKIFFAIWKYSEEMHDPLSQLKSTILQNLPLKNIDRVVLFGSISRRDEKSNSDIDLHILVKDDAAKAKLEPVLDQLTILCLDLFGNLLSPYVLTRAELETRAGAGLQLLTEINKSIVLYPPDKPEEPAD